MWLWIHDMDRMVRDKPSHWHIHLKQWQGIKKEYYHKVLSGPLPNKSRETPAAYYVCVQHVRHACTTRPPEDNTILSTRRRLQYSCWHQQSRFRDCYVPYWTTTFKLHDVKSMVHVGASYCYIIEWRWAIKEKWLVLIWIRAWSSYCTSFTRSRHVRCVY